MEEYGWYLNRSGEASSDGFGARFLLRRASLPVWFALFSAALLIATSAFCQQNAFAADTMQAGEMQLSTQAGTTTASAEAISLNATKTGSLAKSSSEDWYEITLPQAGCLKTTFGAE